MDNYLTIGGASPAAAPTSTGALRAGGGQNEIEVADGDPVVGPVVVDGGGAPGAGGGAQSVVVDERSGAPGAGGGA